MLNVKNETFHYEFIINSKNIVEFINQIDGKGKVEGFVNNLYQPTNYTYKYIRKKKEKYVEIDYDNNKVVKVINVPEFDILPAYDPLFNCPLTSIVPADIVVLPE